MQDKKTVKDTSYGMIGIHHFQGGEQEYFGSDALWNGGVELNIKYAEVERSYNRDWYRGLEHICTVRMTSVQFAEMLTHSNMGDGVPCTIRYTQKDGWVKYKPMERIVEKLDNDIVATTKECDDAYKNTVAMIEDLIKNKKLSRVAGEQLLNTMLPLNSKGTFLKNCMKEEMARVVNEAKASLRNFVEDGNLLVDTVNTFALEDKGNV